MTPYPPVERQRKQARNHRIMAAVTLFVVGLGALSVGYTVWDQWQFVTEVWPEVKR
jgi:Tfp pilus assembly protein PilN